MRDAQAAVLVYDVTSADSIKQAEHWIKEIREYAPTEINIVAAGNKADAQGVHAISAAQGAEWARSNKIPA